MADLLPRVQKALGDRYTIEAEIGHGGMAIVYRAQDLKHHRPVAAGAATEWRGAGPGAFLREIEIAARLSTPISWRCRPGDRRSPVLCHAVRLGRVTADRLNKEGQLPLDEALNIARHVAGAPSCAHSQDIAHRTSSREHSAARRRGLWRFRIARAITVAGGSN
jgi:serine/threonine-protein kinase